MKSRRLARRMVFQPSALLLSLALASQVLAAGWSRPIVLSTNWAHAGDLVTLAPSTVLVIYDEQFNGVYVRRSFDGGVNWGSGLLLSRWRGNSYSPSDVAISGRGSTVDALWTDSRGRVRYARSFDAGGSFEQSVIVGEPSSWATGDTGPGGDQVDVARGPEGLVAIAWQSSSGTDGDGPRVRVRVSNDGGATFGRASVLGTEWTYEPQLAVGNGVVHLAYTSQRSWDMPWHLWIRRTLDAGKTWGKGEVLAGSGQASLAAAGRRAYIVYTTDAHDVVYRRSGDAGKTWSAAATLVDGISREGQWAVVSMQSGIVRVLSLTFSNDFTTAIEYTQSSNGTTWTPAEIVATGSGLSLVGPNLPIGVGFARRRVALYRGSECPSDERCSGMYVRSSP